MKVKDLMRVRRLVETGAAKAIRQSCGLSYREIAEEAQISRSAVYRWESGSRRPRGPEAARYLRVLDELTKE
jgi:DNA-binding transcriptional regulator YiaG